MEVFASEQIEELRSRLAEAEAALAALQVGSADALVTASGAVGLAGADRAYHAFFEAMNEGGLTLDSDGRILHCNPRFAAMVDFPIEALRGSQFSDHLPSEFRAEFKRLLCASQSRSCETQLTTRRGAMRPVRLSLRPMNLDAQFLVCLVVTDLSDRIRAEDLLRESAERFSSLYATMTEGVALHELIFDASGNPVDYALLDVNRAFVALTGLHRQSVLGRRASEVYGTGAAPYLNQYSAVVISGRPTRFETEFGPAPRIFSISAFTYAKNQFATVFEDITERKQSEQLLNLHSEILGNLVEGVSLVRASDRQIVFANPPFEKMFGYDSGELVGRHVSIVNAPGETSAEAVADAILAELEKTGAWSGEIRNIRKDGTTFWSRANIAAFLHHQFGQVWVSVHEDISEHKRLALALANEEQHFSSLIAMTPVGVFETDRRGECTFVNARWSEITGLSLEEAKGSDWSRTLHPDDKDRVDAEWSAAAARGETFKLEYRFQRPNGDLTWVFGQSNKMQSATGELLGYIGTITDITDRKRAEERIRQVSEDLRQLNATLEARVKERTEQLENANVMLQASASDLGRSNKELEQFAYIASHDLQEPVRTVVGFVQLLERRLAGKLDTESLEFMGHVVKAALHMRTMIHGILTYSRIGTRRTLPEQIETAAVVREAMALLSSQISASRAEIEVLALPQVTAERSQLVRLFENLIGNAIKFCSDAAPRVRIEATRDGSVWRFTVTDNGIGIAAEYSERIFIMFQRLHTRDEYGGTGLGLTICKRIVELHGGEIGVDPAPGRGSVFWFTLPHVGDA
jgi:PAS domain S-box-containing protein